MSTESTLTSRVSPKPMIWGAALAFFLLMYLPLYIRASGGLWEREEHAHGPMILMIALYLFWQLRHELLKLDQPKHARVGWLALCVGALGLCLGRVLDFSILEFSSQLFSAFGILLLTGGWPAVRRAWFPLLFLIFMIPLPGIFVDSVTGVLKQWVSVIAEHLLVVMGYPVGRAGVTLVVGPYQLLVADACSGLHSMFTLTAMGMLFLYLKERVGIWHNGVMLALILPVAFIANIIRVMVLVLITYHLGDEAGQGFLHGLAGIFLVVIALLALILMDKIITLFSR
jgi:exosortase B